MMRLTVHIQMTHRSNRVTQLDFSSVHITMTHHGNNKILIFHLLFSFKVCYFIRTYAWN